MSTLFVNNLNTASGSTITVPTGKTIIVTDEGGMRVPGTVIQVVHNKVPHTGGTSTASTSLVDSGLFVEITPKYSNSKILVTYHQSFYNYGGGGDTGAAFVLQRRTSPSGSFTELEAGVEAAGTSATYLNGGGNMEIAGRYSDTFLDTPNSTTLCKYNIRMSVHSGGTVSTNLSNTNSVMTAFEIAQ